MSKFQRGDKVIRDCGKYGKFEGVVQGEYLPGMYEVRLPRGEVCIDESEITLVES